MSNIYLLNKKNSVFFSLDKIIYLEQKVVRHQHQLLDFLFLVETLPLLLQKNCLDQMDNLFSMNSMHFSSLPFFDLFCPKTCSF